MKRRMKNTVLKKEWYNQRKVEGGPAFPVCSCCNGHFGPPHGKNKKLIHRIIRRRAIQAWKKEVEI